MIQPKRHWLDGWHVNPSLNKDYDLIDGLRGIAILMVVACHLFYVNPNAGPSVRFIGGVFLAGAAGVSLFFTLSGFLIALPFWRRKLDGSVRVIPPGYGLRRAWKIYPPLALSLVLLAPVYFWQTGDPSFFQTAFKWLLGLPLVVPVDGRLNAVMWTLVVEVHFYLVLPLAFVCLKRFSVKTSLWIVSILLLVVPTGIRWWGLSRGIQLTLEPQINVHFPIMLDGFVFGVLMAGLETLGIPRRTWARLGDAGAVLGFLSLLAMAWFNLYPIANQLLQNEVFGWCVKVASALLLCYITDPSHPRSRLLSKPWLRWCGIISYEWYLFHHPIFVWIREAFGPAGGNPLKYLVIVLGSLLVGLVTAAVVYGRFSLPILKFGRTRSVS